MDRLRDLVVSVPEIDEPKRDLAKQWAGLTQPVVRGTSHQQGYSAARGGSQRGEA